MSGFPHADAFLPDRWLEQGDTVTVGEQLLRVFHCPAIRRGMVFLYEPQKWPGWGMCCSRAPSAARISPRRPRTAGQQYPGEIVSAWRRHHLYPRSRTHLDVRPGAPQQSIRGGQPLWLSPALTASACCEPEYHSQTARIRWRDLQTWYARGSVIAVAARLNLVEVAGNWGWITRRSSSAGSVRARSPPSG